MSNTCPKCGAAETDRDDGDNGRIWYECGTSVHPTIADDIDQTYECQDAEVEILWQRIEQAEALAWQVEAELATMTARAEKAEAQACVGNECKAVHMVEFAAQRAMDREEEAIRRAEKAEAEVEQLKSILAAQRDRGTSRLCPVCHVGQDQHVRGCWIGERRAAGLAAELKNLEATNENS